MDNQQQLDKIDLYLRGELSSQESSQFESEIQTNETLRSEYDFQKSVVEGINQFRHAQLKARLEAIEVVGVQGAGILSGGIAKLAASIVVLSTIGFGIWWFSGTDSEIPSHRIVEHSSVDAPVNMEKKTWQWEIPEKEYSQVVIDQNKSKSVSISVDSKKEDATIKDLVDTKSTFDIEVNRPELLGVLSDEDNFEAGDAAKPKIQVADVLSSTVDPIDVQFSEYTGALSYKYFDGKLFLYGDFSEDTYQILEINKLKGREIFLFYKDRYYPIQMVNSISELHPITNPSSISDLNILRENKTN